MKLLADSAVGNFDFLHFVTVILHHFVYFCQNCLAILTLLLQSDSQKLSANCCIFVASFRVINFPSLNATYSCS